MMLREIETYLQEHKMPETKFGRLALNDPRLVRDLRAGRQPGVRTVARIESFIARGGPQ